MTLRIHAPNPMRVGETGNVLVTSDNPGVVSLTYGAGLTGPASVTIEGTRVFELNNFRGGEGAAFGGAAGNAWANYSNYAYFIKIDQLTLSEVIETSFISRAITLLASIPGTAGGYNGENWALLFYNFNNSVSWLTRRPAYKAATIAGSAPAQRYIHYAVMHNAATDKLRHITKSNNGTIQEVASILDSVPSATQNYLLIKQCAELYILPVAQVTDQKMVDWAQSGTAPTGYEEHFTFNEEGTVVYGEVSEQSVAYPVKVDTLNYATATIPGSSRRFIDDPLDPVVPYAIVPVTAIATTGTTIDATRPRQGVPARASYSERTEVADQCVVTVNDPVGAVGPAITARVKR
jgi:hypothetical protein